MSEHDENCDMREDLEMDSAMLRGCTCTNKSPTREEINRALAKWEGWVTSVDCPCWINWRGEHVVNGPPDYCESLDAQMPLWERAASEHFYVTIYNDPHWPACVIEPALQWTSVQVIRIQAHTPAEAAARALYALKEANR